MADKLPIISEKMADEPPIISEKMKAVLNKIYENKLRPISELSSEGKLTEYTIKEVIEKIRCPERRPQIAYAIFLGAIIEGKPIEITDPSIPCALLLPGNWNCTAWDVALLHMIFICYNGDKDPFFEKALRSLPEWYGTGTNYLFKQHEKEYGFFFFENYYYDVLKKGKVFKLEIN